MHVGAIRIGIVRRCLIVVVYISAVEPIHLNDAPPRAKGNEELALSFNQTLHTLIPTVTYFPTKQELNAG